MHSQQTIDDLQYQKTQLVKQINEAQRQLTSLDNQIKTLQQVTSESPRIQAFVDSYKDLTYSNGTFYYCQPGNPFYFNYDYPSKTKPLDKAISDMEHYIAIINVLGQSEICKSTGLRGDIHDELDWDNDDTTFTFRLNPDGSITLHAQTFDDWITHTKQRGGVTVSYGYPDDPDPLTILFDTEATVDDPEDLPELFMELAKELNDVKEKEKIC